MILPESFFVALPFVWLGIALWLGLWWRWLTATTKRQKYIFAAGIMGCLALATWGTRGVPIVIVKFPKLGAPVEKQHGKLLFPRHYTFQDGKAAWLWSLPDDKKYFGTIVVNDSPETLRVVLVGYSNSPFGLGKSPPTLVPPMSRFFNDTAIDDIGPDSPPPEAMSSQFSMGARSWLTWGETSSDE